jgi:ABC-type nickel/cobalt efflux system permease component RcnA
MIHWAYHIERKQAKQKHSTETKSVGNTNSTKKRRLTRVLINGLLPCWLIFKIVIFIALLLRVTVMYRTSHIPTIAYHNPYNNIIIDEQR